MAQEKEDFLGRWSRLKREQREQPSPERTEIQEKPPELPPVDTLTTESEFSGFMHPKVGDALRRVALRKLFSDPHFNTPDPFEPFSGDWTVGEPISDEMMATLNQAKQLLLGEEKKEEKEQQEEQPAEEAVAENKPEQPDEPRKQDA